MRETIYRALINEHPREIEKIESNKEGWFKYWTEVLQSLVTYYIILVNNRLHIKLTILLLG